MASSPSSSSGSSSFVQDRAPLNQLIAIGLPAPRAIIVTRAFSSRVDRGSPEGTASTITPDDLEALRAAYRIPAGIRLIAPGPNDRVVFPPRGVALYEEFLRAGLRLPLHPFILNLFDRCDLVPAQLVPNSIRTIYAFMVLCNLHKLHSHVSLFRSLYNLRAQAGWLLFTPRPRRSVKLGLPSSIKGWKSRFFFADVEGVGREWADPNINPNRNSSVLPRDQEAFDLLLSINPPSYRELLSEANL